MGNSRTVDGGYLPQVVDTLLAIADSRREAWSAACSMAMRLTRDGRMR